jgi:2',3'-cyclic-nucleotide 2'-phosphodiesterase (5'-nucleotidase family)
MTKKFNSYRKIFATVTTAALLTSVAVPLASAAPKKVKDVSDTFELSIMHTNDTHANLDKVAKKATAIKEVRAEKPNSLLIDAGDVLTGTLYYNEFKGQADLEFMNLMGYDVMTFGNHEFDSGSTPEGHKELADFIEGASFPFVSSNIDFSSDNNLSRLYKDQIKNNPKDGRIYNGIVKEVDGEKIGIFGLTTEETEDLSSPKVQFEDYIEEAEKTVAAFEKKGIDKIVAVTHLGYDDNPEVDNDLMLAEYVDGIDVIVGGHSHSKLTEPVVVNEDENGVEKDPTAIVQAYQYNDYLGTVDVEFDENGVVVGQAGELIAITDKEEDPEVADKLKGYADQIEELKTTSTGATAASELSNPRLSDSESATVSVRNSETELGNLITDGMLDKAKEFNPDTVIALQNGGGIRAAIDQGDITLGDIITVLPFGNTLATMELTGAQIIEALEHGVSQAPKESGGFLHVAGMKYTYDSTQPTGSRVQTVEVKGADGTYTALDAEAKYVVATNAFTAKGGDGYDVFKEVYDQGLVTDLGVADWEILRDYVQNLETVDPQIEDRIVDASSEASTFSLMYFQDAHEITPVTRADGERGSISRLSTVIDQQQALYPNSSVVFGGDLAGGTLFGGLYRGEPFVEAFNQIGVDVASFGQHDFDFGAEQTKKLINASSFPWVSSNLVNTDETPFTENTTFVQEVNGLRIGYIGLTGDMSNTSASGEVIEKDQLESAKAAVAQLQSQNVDAIVAITQISLEENQAILYEIPEIDIAFREENGSAVESDITVLDDGRLIVSPEGDYGTVVRVDLTFKQSGEKTFNYEVIQVDENVASDPELKELEDSYVQDMEAKLDITIATATADANRRQIGYLIADAFRDWTNADLGWINGGGVRASLSAGDVTLRELYSIMPFANRLMLIEVTGEELKLGLEQAGNSSDSYSGGYALPSGYTYKYDPTASEGNKISDLKLEDGTPIELDQTYSLAITNYVYNGGNGVTAFKDATVLINPDEGTQDANALIEYVTAKGEIIPETGLREYYIGQDILAEIN